MFGILIFFGILQIARSSLAFHFSDEKLLGHVVRPSPSTMNVETLQERLIGTNYGGVVKTHIANHISGCYMLASPGRTGNFNSTRIWRTKLL
jgi:hypothetical protein